METKEADLDGEKSRWSREERSSGLEGEERKDNKGKKYLNKSKKNGFFFKIHAEPGYSLPF